MTIIAALNWDSKKETLSHMTINKEALKVISKPSTDKYDEHIHDKIESYLGTLDKYSKNGEAVIVEYKTYIKQSQFTPKKETEIVDKELNSCLTHHQIDKKHRHKLKTLLRGGNLQKFKNAIISKIYHSKSVEADIIHLWEIALHAIPTNLDRVIKHIEAH